MYDDVIENQGEEQMERSNHESPALGATPEPSTTVSNDVLIRRRMNRRRLM
jgi:hypothetical protein